MHLRDRKVLEEAAEIMDIRILELITGAKQAEGLTVIIDVFRAFTLEAYMFAKGVRETHPIGGLEEAFQLKREHPDWLLSGERGGAKVEGCDFGNSPYDLRNMELKDRTIIHSTSAGTQGIVNAVFAEEIVTGSLVNADAVAAYIRMKQPERVSIVAMGNAGVTRADEDLICAEYIRAKILGEAYDLDAADRRLHQAATHFYDPAKKQYPAEDVPLCTEIGIFPFVIRVTKENGIWTGRKISL